MYQRKAPFSCKTDTENSQKCQLLAFFTNVCHIKGNLPGNTVLPLASVFQKPTKLTIFGIFSKLFSTQNVNLARLARNLKKY